MPINISATWLIQWSPKTELPLEVTQATRALIGPLGSFAFLVDSRPFLNLVEGTNTGDVFLLFDAVLLENVLLFSFYLLQLQQDPLSNTRHCYEVNRDARVLNI